MGDAVVILPWVGEFGWMILQHVRYVHWHPASQKIVCCQAGHECLFPSATGFFTQWENPIPEHERWQHTRWGDVGARDRYYAELRPQLEEHFPGHRIVVPEYTCHWHMSDAPGYKFRPHVPVYLARADVVLSPRHRSFDTTRNWPHWERLAGDLRASGLTIGIAGRRDTTLDMPADCYAWDHPGGDTAGSLDLLLHCHLHVGVDSGISHLAALCDTPTVVLQSPTQTSSQIPVMQRANKGWLSVVSAELWNDYTAVYDAILRAIGQANVAGRFDLAVYAYADCSKTEWYRWCDQLFDRIAAYGNAHSLRVVTRLRLANADESALDWAHRNRHRAHEIDCVRPGRKSPYPLDRPGEARNTIVVDQTHDAGTIAF